MGILDIKNRMSGFQRSNRFMVVLAAMSMIPVPIDPVVVTSTTMPGRSVGEIIIGDIGTDISIAGDVTFNDWTVTIRTFEYIDYRTFKSWFNTIHDPSIREKGTPSSYKTIATVSQLDDKSIPIHNMVLKGVYPKSLSDISFSTENDNQIVTFDVTFNVDDIVFL